jgi:hypothetical protein
MKDSWVELSCLDVLDAIWIKVEKLEAEKDELNAFIEKCKDKHIKIFGIKINTYDKFDNMKELFRVCDIDGMLRRLHTLSSMCKDSMDKIYLTVSDYDLIYG